MLKYFLIILIKDNFLWLLYLIFSSILYFIFSSQYNSNIRLSRNISSNILPVATVIKGSIIWFLLDAFNSSDADYLLMFGADGNNEPEEIPKMLSKIKEGYDQVINSRFSKTSKKKGE